MLRGEIWLVNLDPTVGAELQKTRPVVVVNDDAIGILPLKIVVPLTDWKERYVSVPWMVAIQPDSGNQLQKPSAIDTFQIRSIAQQRFVRRIGQVNDETLRRISSALKIVLRIS